MPALRTLARNLLLQWFRFPYVLPKLGFLVSEWLGVGGGTDHVDYKLGVGQHRYVAAVDLVNGGAHTFRHKALQLGLHCAVTRGHDVPAWFRLPSGAHHILGEQVRGRREVSSPDDLLLLL